MFTYIIKLLLKKTFNGNFTPALCWDNNRITRHTATEWNGTGGRRGKGTVLLKEGRSTIYSTNPIITFLSTF